MGYNTYYQLIIYNIANIVVDLSETEIQIELDSNLDYLFRDQCEASLRWYDHEVDMLQLSKKYPEYIFQLTGFGENPFDIWRKWFENGRMMEWVVDSTIPSVVDRNNWSS